MKLRTKTTQKLTFMLVLTLFLLTGISQAKSPADTKYAGRDVKNGGTISGLAKYDGELPQITQTEVTKNREVCGKSKPSEAFLVNSSTRGIENVVVYLKNIKSGKQWNADNDFAMDQKGCVFTPHVLVVPVGREFGILNNDGILHNVHTRSEINAQVNKAQPQFLKRLKLSFAKTEFIKITCDVHNWMQAWIVVADHPYYVLTNPTGKFEMTDIPPGTYELEFWHEKLGHQTTQVEVKAGETISVDRVFK